MVLCVSLLWMKKDIRILLILLRFNFVFQVAATALPTATGTTPPASSLVAVPQ
jgi:hypothetical protein